MSKHTRLDEKITRMLVNGGLLDNTKLTFFEWAVSSKMSDHGYSQRWRSACDFENAFKKAINWGVPLWFIKRHFNLWAKVCFWEHSDSWGYSNGGRNFSITEDKGMEFKFLNDFILR